MASESPTSSFSLKVAASTAGQLGQLVAVKSSNRTTLSAYGNVVQIKIKSNNARISTPPITGFLLIDDLCPKTGFSYIPEKS
jgi:hypothetical protein